MMLKLLASVLICVLLTSTANGAEYSFSANDIGQYAARDDWSELVEGLPEEIANEIAGLDPNTPQSSVEVIKEKTSVGFWFEKIFGEISSALLRLFPRVAPVLASIMLLGAAQMLLPSSAIEVSSAFMTFGKLTVAVAVFNTTFGILDLAKEYLSTVCSIMNLLTPVMEAIYLAEGNVTQLTVSTSAVMLTVTAIGNINSYVMAPCTSVLFTLSSVASVCDEIDLNRLTSAIRKFIMRIWQIVTIGFSFMLGTQSIIARSADNLAAKTVKFALGSMIPMAGGVLAEAYNTVKEGLSFVRMTAGIGGIIVILLILIPGIVPLIVYKISVLFTATVADMLKLDSVSTLLNEVKGIIEIITAIVLYTSLMLIFAIILFTRSQVG